MARTPGGPPAGAAASTIRHRVAFYETDAMGVVHHANYVKFMERARVQWMADHHRPYTYYLERNLNFAVTHVEVDYQLPARFDDEIAVTVWAEWVRGASLRMAYELTSGEGLIVSAATEHAVVDGEGRVRRIPKEDRAALAALTPEHL